jgi:hypothetical protein
MWMAALRIQARQNARGNAQMLAETASTGAWMKPRLNEA